MGMPPREKAQYVSGCAFTRGNTARRISACIWVGVLNRASTRRQLKNRPRQQVDFNRALKGRLRAAVATVEAMTVPSNENANPATEAGIALRPRARTLRAR